jgi:hypothetical protein
VEMGKREAKPTKEDLKWLLEAIAELSDLRDQALNAIREAEAALEARVEVANEPAFEEVADEDLDRKVENEAVEADGERDSAAEAAQQTGEEDPQEGPPEDPEEDEFEEAVTRAGYKAEPPADREERRSDGGRRDESPWDLEEEDPRAASALEPPKQRPPMAEPIPPPRPPTRRESGETNAAISNLKDTQSFGLLPFRDEPKKSSVREISFGTPGNEKIEKQRRRREPTTIPLVLEDLHEVSPAEPPPLFGAQRKRVSPTWRTIAIASIIAFAFLAGFQVHMFILGGFEGAPAYEIPHTAATGKTANPPPRPATSTPPVSEEISSSSPRTTPETPEPQAAADDSVRTGHPAGEKPKVDTTQAEKPKVAISSKTSNKDEAAERERSRNRAKRKQEREDAKGAREAKKETEAAGEVGTLVVKAPPEDAPVFVLVDGISRGKAPVRVKLKPGIHEVVFSADGRRAMRMVPIREDKTKTIDAKVP